MTTIYIDTNIVLNESYFRSAFSQAFLKACALLQVDVVLPDIVLDEVLGNYPRKLRSKAKEFQKIQREIGRLMDIDELEISTGEIFSDYEDFILNLVDANGVHIASYPEISLKDLVIKSYDQEKPFKETGEGHKDFLVWKSIESHIATAETAPPHYFLTNNTKDFAAQDQEKQHILHPDLAKQIENSEHRPILVTSLRDAWEILLAPKLEGMTSGDIPDLSDEDIKAATSRFLLDDLPGRTAYGFETLPFSNEVSITMVGPDAVSEIICKKVDGDVVIKVTGTVEIEVTGFMEKFSYYHGLEDAELASPYVIEADWNDHVMLVGSTIDTDFELSLFYSLEEAKIVGREVTLPQEIEDDWYH